MRWLSGYVAQWFRLDSHDRTYLNIGNCVYFNSMYNTNQMFQDNIINNFENMVNPE